MNTVDAAANGGHVVRSCRAAIARACLVPLLAALIVALVSVLHTLYLKPLLTDRANIYFSRMFFLLFAATAAAALQRFVSVLLHWYAMNVAAKTETKFDDEFLPLFRKVANVVIWVVALLTILTNLGVNVTAIIATLGVTSLAIALAAQDTIANIIAGFLIMIDRPFRIGDEIKLPSGERVRTIDIGVRRSRFLNLDDGSIVIVPNLDLSKSKITNYTYGKERAEQGQGI